MGIEILMRVAACWLNPQWLMVHYLSAMIKNMDKSIVIAIDT